MAEPGGPITSSGGRKYEDTPKDAAKLLGGRVGRFVLLEKLGEGGMGVVFSAYDPELERKIALKLLNPNQEQDPSLGRARLLREAQAMAKLSHPNVASVYEVGVFGDDVFIAMELVAGGDLRAWRAARPRSPREVVDVLQQAGRGLAAAHAAGLVHRDFKPGNVLVGDDGRVRVVDFGLARGAPAADEAPAGSPEPDDTQVTRTGTVVGTPAYMAPEQHREEHATELSDQFSFCLTLYEALAGERPFGAESIARMTRGEPVEPRAFRAEADVPGWLRAVVLRGLERRPADRHASMAALLEALGRDPALRRRRLALAAGALLLGAGAAAGIWTAARARRPEALCAGAREHLRGVWDAEARDKVRGAFLATGLPYAEDTWRKVGEVLDGYADRWAGMHTEACQAARVRGEQSDEILSARMLCLDERRARLASLVRLYASADAAVVERAGEAARKLPEIEACADLAVVTAQVKPPADAATRARVDALRPRLDDARALHQAGKLERARALSEEVVAAARELGYLPLLADSLLTLGEVLDEAGETKLAEPVVEDALWAAEASGHSEAAAQAWVDLVWVVGKAQARWAEVPRLARLADAAVLRRGDPGDLRAMLSSYQGSIAQDQGKYDDARALFQQAYALVEKSHRADHPLRARVLNNLGAVAMMTGRYDEARGYFETSVAISVATVGEEHPQTARARHNLGNAWLRLHRYDEALVEYRRALALREKLLGPKHPDVGNTVNGIGAALDGQGKLDEALVYYQRSLEIKQAALGEDNAQVANSVKNLARVQRLKGHFEEARALSWRALAIRERVLGPDHPEVADALVEVGLTAQAEGRLRDAEAAFTRALRIREQSFGADSLPAASSHFDLGVVYALGKRTDAARAEHEKALAIRAGRLHDGDEDLAASKQAVAALSR